MRRLPGDLAKALAAALTGLLLVCGAGPSVAYAAAHAAPDRPAVQPHGRALVHVAVQPPTRQRTGRHPAASSLAAAGSRKGAHPAVDAHRHPSHGGLTGPGGAVAADVDATPTAPTGSVVRLSAGGARAPDGRAAGCDHARAPPA